MKGTPKAKYIAPVIHALLCVVTVLFYFIFDQPLMNGPAAIPFTVLMVADLPFSLYAFGIMFLGGRSGTVALVAWAVGGTFWWFLLGCGIDAARRRIRRAHFDNNSPDIGAAEKTSASSDNRHRVRLNRKTWLIPGALVGAVVIAALASSWNGTRGEYQAGSISNFAIAPDGRSILLTRSVKNHTALYRASLDSGRETQLVEGTAWEPTFSPDGKQIAFVRQEKDSVSQIFIMNSDGSNLHTVFNLGTGGDAAPHFSEDSTRLLFSRQVPQATPDPPGPIPWDVYSASIDGGSVTQLTTKHYSTQFGPSFARDGHSFLYRTGGLSPEALYLVSLGSNSDEPEPLLFEIPGGPHPPTYAAAKLSPDGRTVLFLAAAQGQKAFDYDLYRFDLGSNRLTKLTTNNGYATDLALSPDGHWAVFLRWSAPRWGSLPTLSRLYLLNVTTKQIAPLPITGK